MQSTLDIDGHRVPFRIEDGTGKLRQLPASEIGMLVTEALIAAAHFPLAATVRAVVLVISRTLDEISIEIAEQKVNTRIQLKTVTARQFSESLLMLADDRSWDPQVKELLMETLRKDLMLELRRLS